MTVLEKIEMKNKLKDAHTAKQMFEILEDYYDLENARPGFIAKQTFIAKVESVLALLSAKPR